MSRPRAYTEEQRAEILSNPYTARMTDHHVVFTRRFKEFVVANAGAMSKARLFEMAGYRKELFTDSIRKYTIKKILEEAASPQGLKEPSAPVSHPPKKKHSETEFKELQQRVKILEQEIEFLKKSRHLRDTGQLVHPDSSN